MARKLLLNLETIRIQYQVVVFRWNAMLLRYRGAKIGDKALIGRKCQIDKPWRMTLGDRCKFEDLVKVKIVEDDAEFTIGNHSFIGHGTTFDCSKNISLGEHVLLAPGCFITDHSHGMSAAKRIDQQDCDAKSVVIGNDVWIGANSTILMGVTLGKGSVIGAGSVVNCNVPEYAVYAGVPARSVSSRK